MTAPVSNAPSVAAPQAGSAPAPQRQGGFAQLLNNERAAVQPAETAEPAVAQEAAPALPAPKATRPSGKSTTSVDHAADKAGPKTRHAATRDLAETTGKKAVVPAGKDKADKPEDTDRAKATPDDVTLAAIVAPPQTPTPTPPATPTPPEAPAAAAPLLLADTALPRDAKKAEFEIGEDADVSTTQLASRPTRPAGSFERGADLPMRTRGDDTGAARETAPRAETAAASAWRAAAERVALPVAAAGEGAKNDIAALGAATASAAATPSAKAAEAAAALPVNVPTPVVAPEFPQVLGLQISVLARDGVQHAELHLNPAEMGPVSVHIAIDGTQAQVNFGAESALTRQVIEGGLPELASSLRDAGFTLSGGGVHQHAQGRRDGGNASGESSGHGRGLRIAGEGDAVAAATSVTLHGRTAAGGIDLYA